jgi:hypothetical protein
MEAPTVVVFLVMAFAIVAHGLTQVLQAWMMPHAMYHAVKLIPMHFKNLWWVMLEWWKM